MATELRQDLQCVCYHRNPIFLNVLCGLAIGLLYRRYLVADSERYTLYGVEDDQFRAMMTYTGWLNTGPDATPLEKCVIDYTKALTEASVSSSPTRREAALQRSILIQARARYLLTREGLM